MTYKKVYVVRLSEDGVYGAYTNKKRCWEAIEATGYITHSGEQAKISNYEKENNGDYKPDLNASYANFCKAFNHCSIVTIDCNDASIEVNLFGLNQ